MSKTPKYDAKVKELIDSAEPGERTCDVTGEKWEMSEEVLGLYKKFNVPPITVSPNTLWKQMAYFDIGFQFWWNKHPETGKPVLSFHHPASGVRVMPDAEWYSHDFSSINKTYDPQRPFFEQLDELKKQVPLLANFNVKEPENSISLLSLGDRNSYFMFACRSERSFFSAGVMGATDSSLGFCGSNVQSSHHTLHSQRIFRCKYVSESQDCLDSVFLFDCRNCKNCFGATNKRNAHYVFFNEQLDQEEYEKRLSSIDLGRRSELEQWQKKFDDLLIEQAIWPENFNTSAERSTGEYLNNAVRCQLCYDAYDAPIDNYHCAWSYGSSQSNVHCWGLVDDSQLYMCLTTPQSSECKFCYRSLRSDSCEYCFMCADIRDCFGCVGIRHKQFCIFNTQYEEEEYYRMVDQIKCEMLDRGEYGQYLPVTMSTSYVPENGAVVYCGISEKELTLFGGNMFDPNADGATGAEKIDHTKMKHCEDIPDSIDDLTDDWVGVPIYDKESKRTFSFLKPELEHYRALRIAPPNIHFIRRLHGVSTKGQLSSFEERECGQCQKRVLTSVNKGYSDRTVYCKDCYHQYLEQHG